MPPEGSLCKRHSGSVCTSFGNENNESTPSIERNEGDERDDARPLSPSPEDESSLFSRNITLTLVFNVIANTGRSLWNTSVLSAYVYLLKGNNAEYVGYITAAMGISQLIVSFPAGMLADHYRRDTMLKIGSVVGIIAVIVTVAACAFNDYRSLLLALAMWGCFWGITNTALSALFADSIPDGQRSKYFTQRSTLVVMGNAAGPFAALVMFFILGNHWSTADCARVMALAQVISFPSLLVLCFFSDDDTAIQRCRESEREEGNNSDVQHIVHVVDNNQQHQVQHHTTNVEASPSLSFIERQMNSANRSDQSLVEPLLPQVSSMDEQNCGEENNDSQNIASDLLLGHDSTDRKKSWDPRWILSNRKIPSIIATADLIAGIAAGMSLRYFPIFFVDNLQLGPVLVQVLYITSRLMVAVCMNIAQRFSKRFGRCHVAAVCKWIGVSCMFALIAAHLYNLPRWIICVMYIFRTGLTNCTGALTRSVLMDNVPKAERGKWAALESVNMFSWSGSSVLGGFLVGKVGLLPLFAVTGTIQLVSSMFLFSLWNDDKEISESTQPQTISQPADGRDRGT